LSEPNNHIKALCLKLVHLILQLPPPLLLLEMMADEIKKYDTEELINSLHKKGDLKLSKTAIKILEKEEISQEKLEKWEMLGGSAIKFADFAKECKKKKLRAFSSYKTKADLEKVLQEDYKISSGDITLIPQFKPVTCPVNENSPEFKLCIDDILHRIRNIGPVVDSSKAMRCEYISTILHMAVSLLKGLVITPPDKNNQRSKYWSC
jgi:hypothetical protein